MPIDPKGTAPGLTPAQNEPEKVNIRCKKCDSIVALIIKIPGQAPGQHMYRCAQCHFTWGLNTGGTINI